MICKRKAETCKSYRCMCCPVIISAITLQTDWAERTIALTLDSFMKQRHQSKGSHLNSHCSQDKRIIMQCQQIMNNSNKSARLAPRKQNTHDYKYSHKQEKKYKPHAFEFITSYNHTLTSVIGISSCNLPGIETKQLKVSRLSPFIGLEKIMACGNIVNGLANRNMVRLQCTLFEPAI